MEYAADLRSAGEIRVGSSPTVCTLLFSRDSECLQKSKIDPVYFHSVPQRTTIMSLIYSRRSPSLKKKKEMESFQKEMARYRRGFDLYVKNNWIYYGGVYNEHLQYYTIMNSFRQEQEQEQDQDFCMCGRMLRKERYYLKKITPYSTTKKEIVCKQCIAPYIKAILSYRPSYPIFKRKNQKEIHYNEADDSN